MKSTTHIGVVIDRSSGAVNRIMNPTYDWELTAHYVGPFEFMVRIPKTDFGISAKTDAMTIEDVHRVIKALSP